MRKWLSIILFAAMLIGLLGCASTGSNSTGDADADSVLENAIYAGYAKEPYKVVDGVTIGAAGGTPAKGILDTPYVTCVAIGDAEGNVLLFFTYDISQPDQQVCNSIKKKISKQTGIPVENMQWSGTHTHSAPGATNVPNIVEVGTQVGLDAVADMSQARMYIGTANTEKLNFVRHYTTESNGIIGDNFGDHRGAVRTGHTTEADTEMRLIKFVREDGKKDIVMMNWQAHANQTGFYGMVSADFVGPCRDKMEKDLDCLFAFYQGAAGNLNARSSIASENRTSEVDYKDHGETLAQTAIAAMSSMVEAEGGPIKVKVTVHTAKTREISSEFTSMIPVFQSVFAQTGSRHEAFAATGGVVNSEHAIKWASTVTTGPETKDIEIRAISFGSAGFITAPYEMFDTQGVYIRENSPYDMTFTMCYCNGHDGYVPSELAYEQNTYEVDSTWFAKGTAEELAELYVDMLKELHG